MNEWIPCGKRLPDKEGEYIVTDDAGGMTTATTDEFGHYANGEPMWLFGQHITAWMPFPKPYKEEKMKKQKPYISIDSYEIGEDSGGRYLRFSIGSGTVHVLLHSDHEKNPHILDLEKHDQIIKEDLLNDLRKLAQADSRTLEYLFGKYAIGYVLRDCSNEEILSGTNKFTNRKNRLKDLLEQNAFSIEEAKWLLED